MQKMKSSVILGFLLAILLIPFAYGAQYDIKEMTPAVEQAISNRQARFSEIQDLKREGLLGEDNKGYVKALGDSQAAGRIAAAESADRSVIYQAIVDQNRLGPGGLEQVERTFAEVQRERAAAGDSVQLPSGEWIKK